MNEGSVISIYWTLPIMPVFAQIFNIAFDKECCDISMLILPMIIWIVDVHAINLSKTSIYQQLHFQICLE